MKGAAKRAQDGVVVEDTRPAALEFRTLSEPAEYAACVKLQRLTWGPTYHEVVPASILRVAQGVGGVVSGAVGAKGELYGFVFGMTGVSAEGLLTHWSHMLAVHPEFRNQGIGRRLKRHQRARLRELGVAEIRWTFDPLVARNAHLNLHHLGADIVQYVPDMYGETGSDLHAFGTDRFVVRWPVDPGSASRPPIAAEDAEAPVINANPDGAGSPDIMEAVSALAVVRVEIPSDVESLRHGRLELARAWRASSRAALLGSLSNGFRVTGFVRSADGRCYYVLRRTGKS
jgi:chorismate synthase